MILFLPKLSRFAVIKHSDFFGKFDDDWRVDFSEVVDTSYNKNNIISIPVKEPQPGVGTWVCRA